MKRLKIFLFVGGWSFLLFSSSVSAIYDPLSVPNNRFGVHILDTSEIFQAAKLVNSSGGDWGYVTVPMRIDDRDFPKWFSFFQNCSQLHVIPIIRLATFSFGTGWVAPHITDLVDFSNFLNQMPWPTKNRYIILFNEPNHAAEWGGSVSPQQYAGLLVDAATIFKSRSQDFFLLTSGLDMSVPTSSTSLDALKFYKLLYTFSPRWDDFIDGLAVHAYPNPAFSSSVHSTTRYGLISYRFELSFLNNYGFSPKPLFITETGLPNQEESYPVAFNDIWIDRQIVAITPFILQANSSPFTQFSLLDASGSPSASYRILFDLPKSVGSPLLSVITPPVQSLKSTSPVSSNASRTRSFWDKLNFIRRWLNRTRELSIGNTKITYELANTPATRSRGLSGRTYLAPDHGMLFTFETSDIYSFWMKDMHFPLDIIWLRDYRVVDISLNIPPPSDAEQPPVIIKPQTAVNQVLEVVSGFVDRNNIRIGDNLSIL